MGPLTGKDADLVAVFDAVFPRARSKGLEFDGPYVDIRGRVLALGRTRRGRHFNKSFYLHPTDVAEQMDGPHADALRRLLQPLMHLIGVDTRNAYEAATARRSARDVLDDVLSELGLAA